VPPYFLWSELNISSEWNYKAELDWPLLEHDLHKQLQRCIRDLNVILKEEGALYEKQFSDDGFEWLDLNHRQESIISFKRKGKKKKNDLIIILNMTPVVRNDWQVTVKGKEYSEEIFNSDHKKYGGTGNVYNPDIRCEVVDEEENSYRLTLNLPPLAGIIIK
jgi:1,4-alpha-glucan branching enzyme